MLRSFALVLFATGVAAAQSPSEPERLPRSGLFAEGSPVTIGIVRSETETDSKVGFALGGSLGGGVFLDESTSVGVRFANTTYVSEIEVEPGRSYQRLSIAALAGADRYFGDTLWLGAGGGYAWVIDLVTDNNNSEENNWSSSGGFAGNARVGVDFYPLRRGALRAAVDGTVAYIEDSTFLTVTLQIGFHVY
jgi:hypothetical protein